MRCYDTGEDLGIPVFSGSLRKMSYLGDSKSKIDSKSRIEKKEDSWRSNLDMDPLNPKFCSLEILLEEKNRRKIYDPSKASLDETNVPIVKGIPEEEKDESTGKSLPNGSVIHFIAM